MPLGSPRRRPPRCSKRPREVGGWKGRQALGSTITLEAAPQLLFSCSPAAVKEFHFLGGRGRHNPSLLILAQKGSIPIGNLLSKQWFIVWKWNGGTKYFRETLFQFKTEHLPLSDLSPSVNKSSICHKEETTAEFCRDFLLRAVPFFLACRVVKNKFRCPASWRGNYLNSVRQTLAISITSAILVVAGGYYKRLPV